MMKDFSLLPQELQDALKQQNITEPTPIQAQAIEPALAGKDVLGTAQTGTGKTYAFLLPLITRMMNEPDYNALILSPTRELAQQTYDALKLLKGHDKDFKFALVIGGDNIQRQFTALEKNPRVVVATPGRIIDHMSRGTIDLKHTRYIVLDETDRMLDMGFRDDIRRIINALPEGRQTLMFSATMPKEITDLAAQFLKDPVRVKIGSVTSTIDLVSQEIVCLGIREKLPQLIHELNTRQGSVLVFVRTKHGAERLAKQLKMYGVKVNALHGDLRQSRRTQVLNAFREGTLRVLIATDVAARGIDVPHIAHVINYDLPQQPEDYIHRIGRTGRAGSVGCAVSFIAGDEEKWRDIADVTQFGSPVKLIEKTTEPLPEPKFVPQEERPVRRNAKRGRKQEREPRTVEEFLDAEEREKQRLERADAGFMGRNAVPAAADHVLTQEEINERLRKAEESRARIRKAKESKGETSAKTDAKKRITVSIEEQRSGKKRRQESASRRGKDASSRKARKQDNHPVITRTTIGGIKVVRVGASKNSLQKKLSDTVENVKRGLRKLKQKGFSKFFKKRRK